MVKRVIDIEILRRVGLRTGEQSFESCAVFCRSRQRARTMPCSTQAHSTAAPRRLPVLLGPVPSTNTRQSDLRIRAVSNQGWSDNAVIRTSRCVIAVIAGKRTSFALIGVIVVIPSDQASMRAARRECGNVSAPSRLAIPIN